MNPHFGRFAMIATGCFIALLGVSHAIAGNYSDRIAHIINVSPYVEITSFSFGNEDRDRRTRFTSSYRWRSTAQQPIIAFEIVMLKYDAFDERLIGTRFRVQGKNSVDWSPLMPGESQADGGIAFGEEDVFTGIAYVRKVRLADGTVWRVDEAKLAAELKKIAPSIRNPGSLAPDPKVPAKE